MDRQQQAELDYQRAQFERHCELPSYLKKGAKFSDVPYVTHMRASFFESAQDIASQILTYSDNREVVERLATELYEEAKKYV